MTALGSRLGDSLRPRIDTGFATPLSRRVGGALLVGAGLVNVSLAVWILAAVGSESAFLGLLEFLGNWWSESRLLDRGATLSFLVGTVAPAFGAFVLAVGVVQVAAGIAAVVGRGYRAAIALSLIGAVTVVTIPLCAVAAFLCWASEDHFDAPSGGWIPARLAR